MARWTLRLSSGRTVAWLFRTRDTVPTDTSAARAMSRMVNFAPRIAMGFDYHLKRAQLLRILDRERPLLGNDGVFSGFAVHTTEAGKMQMHPSHQHVLC